MVWPDMVVLSRWLWLGWERALESVTLEGGVLVYFTLKDSVVWCPACRRPGGDVRVIDRMIAQYQRFRDTKCTCCV